ncbi:Adenylate cyclase, class 3 [Abditibacterium utsteinense]|uniref:Adenylate cyclase, class 3 n=1 Tax=Abditibacterium utsteinense TaxID=1960156 RepID=A0A2S8SV46_9BACT|nr:adenylate/guanylate cyclase domain-containing protein [Abditibacterium utsteinense]PQV64678.1 Adenylate cyclase, class 3 [Abditibacterium utsteinense]
MSFSPPKDSHLSIGTFALFDIALAVLDAESREWGEEAGMNLFLDESIALVRRETELMAAACGARTGERARVFSIVGAWSEISASAPHYAEVAKYADVWVFGAPDQDVDIPGVVAVPVPKGSPLENERGVVVEAPSFGAALFAGEGGFLDPGDIRSRYYEGFLTGRQDAVDAAAGRLAALLKLSPLSNRWVDTELVGSWYGRLNRRILETLASQRLQLRSREEEIGKMRDETSRMEKMVRGYVGGQTWDEVQRAMEQNQEEIADLDREELTICFCDLVGFTKLSERLTPPEVATILNDHFARLYNIVRTHGGTIDKFIGDAMLAYFREPIEAFQASKKMVQESRSVRLKADWALPIQVRVGLNTGPVAIANLGVPEIRQRTILGEHVNFAQRMQSAAPPHSILISERTLRYLPHTMIRSLEPIQVEIKGRRDLVTAYLWTTSTERREVVNDQMSVRSSLLKTGSRSSLMDRFRKPEN